MIALLMTDSFSEISEVGVASFLSLLGMLPLAAVNESTNRGRRGFLVISFEQSLLRLWRGRSTILHPRCLKKAT